MNFCGQLFTLNPTFHLFSRSKCSSAVNPSVRSGNSCFGCENNQSAKKPMKICLDLVNFSRWILISHLVSRNWHTSAVNHSVRSGNSRFWLGKSFYCKNTSYEMKIFLAFGQLVTLNRTASNSQTWCCPSVLWQNRPEIPICHEWKFVSVKIVPVWVINTRVNSGPNRKIYDLTVLFLHVRATAKILRNSDPTWKVYLGQKVIPLLAGHECEKVNSGPNWEIYDRTRWVATKLMQNSFILREKLARDKILWTCG
jgi:hypothetical protein